jgi:transcription initiation factor TFIID subunit 7
MPEEEQPRRQLVKLKVNTKNLPTLPSNRNSQAPAPSSTTTATPKLKLKFGGASTPKVEAPPEPQSATSSKPSGTIIKLKKPKKTDDLAINTGKKREHDRVEGDVETPASAGPKKLKLVHKQKNEEPQSATTPFLKIKAPRKIPTRQKGVGYDSEASDRELDPAIEENFILRMQPGEDCDYIRKAIAEKNFGKNGAKIRVKFLQNDGRRAVVIVRGKIYAAAFVDMPCIIETWKSWDKKAFVKAADACQMLLVLGTVKNEAEALNYPIPDREIDRKTWSYAHGLTPPMHWVKKRRFRKRTSAHTIERVEAMVNQLLEADAAASEVRFEVLDPQRLAAQKAQEDFDQSELDFGEDAYGEMDYEDDVAQEQVAEEDLAAEFESYLGGGPEVSEIIEVQEVAETPASSSAAALETHNATDSEAGTPAAVAIKDESADDDDEEDEEEDMDEDELEQRAELQRQREEIAELEAAIKEQTADLERMSNELVKKRLRSKIQGLQADLQLKKAAIGEEEDD